MEDTNTYEISTSTSGVKSLLIIDADFKQQSIPVVNIAKNLTSLEANYRRVTEEYNTAKTRWLKYQNKVAELSA